MEYYIYVHKKLTNNSVFYVGRGKGRRKNTKQNRNLHWQRIVEKHGFSVEVIEENLTFEEANTKEIFWIQKFRDEKLVLANITLGGGGVSGRSRTECEKQSISIKLTGKPHSDEHKAKMLGNKNGVGKRSDDFRKKMSEIMKGKPKSEIHREKLKNALKGKPLSAEHRANVAAANARRKTRI